ncbi:MAG: polysulfide reductase NrfD [Archaeoglobaceae archaeon]|nr:polysulfide reductase NrfD [Archaeoglobaceae archaeon]
MEISGKNLKKAEIAAIFTLTLLVLLGIIGIIQIHTRPIIPIEPYESALGMPWRLLVAVYVFFVVSTTGLCIVASLGEVFGISKLEPIVKEGLLMALVTILVGLMTIGLEIEQVFRGAYAMLGHTNPQSIMFWMIMFYVLYVIFLIVEMWFYFYDDLIKQRESDNKIKSLIARILTIPKARETKDFARVIGFITVVTAIIAHSNLGALFAVNYLPFWHGPLLPIYFILSAIVSGAALTVIGTVVTDYVKGVEIKGDRYEAIQTLRFVLGLSLVITAFFTAWKFILKAYPNSTLFSREAVEVFISGSYALNFWGIEVLIGLVTPVILLAIPKIGRKVEGVFAASMVTIIGIFFLRIDLVMGGQVLKLISGLKPVPFKVHPFEIMATIGFMALAILLYYIGYKLLPMEVEG